MKKARILILFFCVFSIMLSGCGKFGSKNGETDVPSGSPNNSQEENKSHSQEENKSSSKEENKSKSKEENKSKSKKEKKINLKKENKNNSDKDKETNKTSKSADTISKLYVALLNEYHQFILNYDQNSELDNKEIDDSKAAIWEMFLILEREDILEMVGYAIMDINQDKVPELFIGSVDSEAGTTEVGSIYAVFTLAENKPQLILAGNPRDQYFYLGDGEFVNQSTGLHGYSNAVFQLEAGETTLTSKELFLQPEESVYYYSETGDYDIDKAQKLDQGEFSTGVNAIIERIEAISYTPFSKYQAPEKTQTQTKPKKSKTDPLVFKKADDIMQFLVGEWTYWHAPSSTDMAKLLISEDGAYSFEIIDPDNKGQYHSEGYIEILDYTQDEEGLDNTISFQTEQFEVPSAEKDMFFGDNFDGDYTLTYKTLADGEIIVELYQINNGITFMFEAFDAPVHVFRKTSDLKPTSSIKKNAEFYAICSKKDYDKKLIWLDEVEYDSDENKVTYGQIREAITYQTTKLVKKSKALNVEYLCDLVYVTTDADGKVVSYEEIEFDNYPFKEDGN
ncbi:hypothetical protein EII17_09620 [Clostridiales bacterium COT073_COT-073]|nr:hypothetical protein EII17_09620 [Clostridiales bacterium COT073_COT-073]